MTDRTSNQCAQCSAYREVLEEVAEVLADMGWHTDRGLRMRVIEVLRDAVDVSATTTEKLK